MIGLLPFPFDTDDVADSGAAQDALATAVSETSAQAPGQSQHHPHSTTQAQGPWWAEVERRNQLQTYAPPADRLLCFCCEDAAEALRRCISRQRQRGTSFRAPQKDSIMPLKHSLKEGI